MPSYTQISHRMITQICCIYGWQASWGVKVVSPSPQCQKSSQAKTACRLWLRSKLSGNIIEPSAFAGTGLTKLACGNPHEVPTRDHGGYGRCGGHVPPGQSQWRRHRSPQVSLVAWWELWERAGHMMLVHIFGTTSTPSVATFALHKCETTYIHLDKKLPKQGRKTFTWMTVLSQLLMKTQQSPFALTWRTCWQKVGFDWQNGHIAAGSCSVQFPKRKEHKGFKIWTWMRLEVLWRKP